MEVAEPPFAIEAGIAALRWLVEGYGYEITSVDVLEAYDHTMEAAGNAGRVEEAERRIRELLPMEGAGSSFVGRILSGKLGG